MHDGPELERLVAHIGEPEARRIADLAASQPAWWGIPRVAFDELARATRGFSGKYGAAGAAREALEDLIERYNA